MVVSPALGGILIGHEVARAARPPLRLHRAQGRRDDPATRLRPGQGRARAGGRGRGDARDLGAARWWRWSRPTMARSVVGLGRSSTAPRRTPTLPCRCRPWRAWRSPPGSPESCPLCADRHQVPLVKPGSEATRCGRVAIIVGRDRLRRTLAFGAPRLPQLPNGDVFTSLGVARHLAAGDGLINDTVYPLFTAYPWGQTMPQPLMHRPPGLAFLLLPAWWLSGGDPVRRGPGAAGDGRRDGAAGLVGLRDCGDRASRGRGRLVAAAAGQPAAGAGGELGLGRGAGRLAAARDCG